MKKLVQINVVCNGSTGRIMCDIAKKAEAKGLDSYCFYGRGNPDKNVKCVKIGNKLGVYFHVFFTRFFNKHGHGSYFATKKMIRQIKKINPDIIHLHNIHGYYLNLKILFNYLKKEFKGKVIWTLHDCWAFTGHCAHFTATKCYKWKKECYNCPQVKEYPKSCFFDTSNSEYKLKRKLFGSLNNMTIVAPSNWIACLIKQSFLSRCHVEIINNGVNLNIFRNSIDNQLYSKYKIPKDKKIILGVANVWTKGKGLQDFIKLSYILPKDAVIVLVGIDEKLKKELPKSVIGIKNTKDPIELAKIYSMADVFFNPTYEDNYPTTNLESIACGTFVICYDTGGCKEQIGNKSTGLIVKKGDYKKVAIFVKKNKKRNKIDNNYEQLDINKKYSAYLDLYSKYLGLE